MSQIKYICFFDSQEINNDRYFVVAATNKMQYIINVLHDHSITPHLISCSWSTRGKFGFVNGFTDERENYSITFFPSFGGRGMIVKVLQKLCYKVSLLWYLLRNTHKGEVVMAYHSMAYSGILSFTRKLKRYKLILEVEELYQDVIKSFPLARYNEMAIIKNADAYIFSTELLKNKLNNNGKPDVVIYGTYNVERSLASKFDDGKIHVVYAGTFDPRKGGTAAASAAEFLPNNYTIHICGFGNEKDTASIMKIVENNNRHPNRASLSFEGLLKGTSYICFLQSCQIGLCTQNPNASFNATSFPSKILSYMSNGLSVVSIRINSIERSMVGEAIVFYDRQSPDEIAKAILRAPLLNNNLEIIKRLDIGFRKQFISLIATL